MQVQRYDDDTYILRQSIKTNFEGPFIFLFFGTERVLQIDTGAVSIASSTLRAHGASRGCSGTT